jgi:hypothetical protein
MIGHAKRSTVDRSNVHTRTIVMRYPIRAYQPDTTVVNNDHRRHHQASQPNLAPDLNRGR